jgi:GNAT superfamily N-acetyltransferase
MLGDQQVEEADRLIPHENGELIIRNYCEDDFESIKEMEKKVYPPPWSQDDLWSSDQLVSHIETFSEGALCAEYENEIVGTMTTLIVDEGATSHPWEEITDNGYLQQAHQEDGDILYVADLQVNPEYRKLGIGQKLMYKSYNLVRMLNLKRLVGAVRMPGYERFAEQLQPEQYVEQVLKENVKDPVINFMIRCGRKPVGVVHNYLKDEKSRNNALIMEWRNPQFNL